MRQSTNVLYQVLRLPSLCIVIVVIAVMFMLAACGETKSDEPVSTPAQSAPTKTPNTVTTSGSEIVYVSPKKWGDFKLKLISGDTVQIHFKATFRAMSGSTTSFTLSQMYAVEEMPLVSFGVQDQLGEIIYKGEPVEEDTVTITAESTGLHTFSFVNPFTYQGEDVDVDYIINP